MEFLVTMTTDVPSGTSPEEIEDMRVREAARSRQLSAQGLLRRLWRPPLQPGEWRTLGLFVARDVDELQEVLASMPLSVWRTDEITPLSPHPNDPEPVPATDDHVTIDVARLPAPREGIAVTLFIAVRSIARSRAFYSEVLGGTVVLAENPCIVQLANSWILMNPGGGPTPDKPDISVVDYEAGCSTSIFMNLRVADIETCYRLWSDRGAQFVTPPIDRGAEIRCYMRDPDGYLIEVGQATGLLTGHLAAKRPEDLPG